jgi:hypothetical protein
MDREESMQANRRKVVAGTVALAAVGFAGAQSRRLAALSLVGDKIEIIGARPEIGSRISQNRRRWADDAESTLDRYVLQAVDRAVRAQDRSATLSMLTLPGSPLYERPERAFDGRQVALPGRAVDALIAARASHLLLITKVRGDAKVPLYHSTAGVGSVSGIGFYVDPDLRLIMRSDGATAGHSADGVLAPFVYVRISLVDVQSGEVVNEELVREMRSYATASNPKVSAPWDVLSAEEKVDVLRKMIDEFIGAATARLLRAG